MCPNRNLLPNPGVYFETEAESMEYEVCEASRCLSGVVKKNGRFRKQASVCFCIFVCIFQLTPLSENPSP